jgi:hypothetical protein
MKKAILALSFLFTLAGASFAQRGIPLVPYFGLNTIIDSLRKGPLFGDLSDSTRMKLLKNSYQIQLDGTRGRIWDDHSRAYDRFYPEVPGKVFPDENMIKPIPEPRDAKKKKTPLPSFPNWRIQELKSMGAKL